MPEQVKPKQKSSKGILMLVGILGVIVVIIGVGYGGYVIGYKKGQEDIIIDPVNPSGTAGIEKKLEEVRAFIPGLLAKDEEVKSIAGKITKIDNNQITFEATKPTKSIYEFNEVATFTVDLSGDTEIISQKTVIETAKKEESQEGGEEGEIDSEPRLPEVKTETKKLKISDLEEGDVVLFESGEDIYGKTKFNAIRIIKTQDSTPTTTP